MSEFKDNLVTLIVFQLVMACAITDMHGTQDRDLFIFIKLLEIFIFLFVPLIFWHWQDNPRLTDDE